MRKKLADYPNLMLDWSPSLNPDIDPKVIGAGSHKEVTWVCHKCGRQWNATINRRALLGTGCSCDAMERKTKSLQRSLVEKKGSLAQNRPDIAKQWHPTKNGNLTPNDITCGTEYKAWWIDEEGNEWQSSVAVRCRSDISTGVPASKLIVGKNDLATLNPRLASEWNYKRNNPLKPCDVMPHTRMKVWWICHKGHEWVAYISSRTKGNNCPECNKERGTSFPEQAIYYYAKLLFSDAVNRYKTDYGDEVDVFIPSVFIGIEFDGSYYHRSDRKQKIDFDKNERLKKAGIHLIRVAERTSSIPNNTEFSIRYDTIANRIKNYDGVLNELFSLISSISGNAYSLDINVDRDTPSIWEQYITNEKENSIISKRPELIEEWNYEKNGSLRPEYISYASNKKIWWKCKKCGFEWKTTASNRTKGTNCPVCTGNLVVKGLNDLTTTQPVVASTWNTEKNMDLKPEMFSAFSGKVAWWKCSKCGYEWKTSIANRVKSLGCPACNGQVATCKTSLAFRFPVIASQWVIEMNDTNPEDILPSSEKKIWWRCDKGHIWNTSVRSRTHGNNCPYCGNKKVLTGFNDLKSANPPFMNEWLYLKNNVSPDKLLAKSCKKVWWKCANGHEYESAPYSRWLGEGCPYCDGKKSLIGVNDLQSTHPEIAEEWDYEKNGNLKPYDVKAGSNKKVWWKCKKCGKEWQAIIWTRCKGRGCPYCSGKTPTIGVNDICTTHPELMKEWDYSKNEVKPETKSHGSVYKAWWKCKNCGHEWQATIGSRSLGRGCPKCARKKRVL